MNFNGTMTGCPTSTCPNSIPTTSNCCNVVQTCNVEEVPHYTNYHTHQVNNCIKRHINIPVYSSSYENVMVNEYVEAQPIYQAPTYQQTVGNQMYNQGYAQTMYQQPMYQQPAFPQGNTGYQGNVGTDPTGAQNFMNPGVNPQGFNPYGF